MDTKKLRQKILDLAIRGKLVPQDPNDEPASVLLERIRAEKEQLIKEGKIKRTKKSNASDTSHYENVPFEVPESWEWVTVGDIFTHNTGKTLNSSNSQGEIMSYITTSNLYWNRFDLTVIKEMPFTESEVAKCTVTRGDLLVCEGGDIGRAAIWNYDFDIRIQNHIHRLRSIIQLNHLFYYHVFYLFKSLNLIGGKGVAIQGLSSSDLAKLLVPLPPISEQNRIVSELNRWLSVVDQIELDQYSLKNTIADIKNRILRLAISGKLVGQDISDEPAIELLKKINASYISCDNRHYENLPSGWQEVAFDHIFKSIPTKRFQVQQKEIQPKGTIPVISQSANYIEGYTDDIDKIFTATPVIVFGDHTRVVKFVDFPFVVGADGVKIYSTKIFPPYGYYLIEHAAHNIENKGYGRHSQYIAKQRYPLPPFDEQKRIVESVRKMFMIIDSIVADL